MTDSDPRVRSPLSLRPQHLLNNLVTAVALLFWGRVVLYAYFQNVPRAKFGAVFLGGGMVIYVLAELREAEGRLERVGLWVAAAVSVGVPGYVWLNYEVLETVRIGYALEHEYALGAVFALVVVALTYRAFGAAFVGVVVLAVGYAYFGASFPGVLRHGGIGERQIVNVLTLEFDGFFGSVTQIVAAWVALFLLYAGLMRGYGAFDLVVRLSVRAAGYLRSGVAQSAVVSSLVVGSINGAQTANAAMTGSFTIPLMRESGMRSETAGGIEAVASSGGQIMPPIMGAAAFVMASLLANVGYVDVLVAGLIPALVFYVSVAVGVHYMSIKQLPERGVDLDERLADLEEGNHPVLDVVRFGVPFAVLLYALGVAQWTVVSAALYACLSMVLFGAGIPLVLAAVRDDEDLRSEVRAAVTDTVSGCRFGAVTVAPIAIVIAAVNGIVDLLNATGLPGKLSLALVGIAGGAMFLTVVLAMGICLVLGLGMPTVAAYTIVALLVAPTLTGGFAVPDLAAHFFVFYAAILSGITPPIAIAVVVTTGIAGSNFWRTSVEALKLAVPLFVLPFTFIYNPEIVTGGLSARTVQSGLLVLLGGVAITHGLNCARRPFNVPSPLGYGPRALYVVFGVVAMAHPALALRVGTVLVAALLFAVQTWVPRFRDVGAVAEND